MAAGSCVWVVMAAVMAAMAVLGEVESNKTVEFYIENGELVAVGEGNQDKAESFTRIRREKIEKHIKDRQSGPEGIRFAKQVEKVDATNIEIPMQGISAEDGSAKFDARKLRQLAREGEIAVIPASEASQFFTSNTVVFIWIANFLLMGIIYAYCKSPYSKYLWTSAKKKKIGTKRTKAKAKSKSEAKVMRRKPVEPAGKPTPKPSHNPDDCGAIELGTLGEYPGKENGSHPVMQ